MNCNICQKKINPGKGFLVCEDCKIRYCNLIFREECLFCSKYFISLKEVSICKQCFEKPCYSQRECFERNIFAQKLGKKDMYELTEEEEKNTPSINENNWKLILESIFG